MNGGLLRRTIVASAALACVFATVFATLLFAVQDLNRTAERARHSEQVIAAANQSEKLVLDLETGERGFILTGDERFLEPWTAALTTFPLQAKHLQTLASDNPEQETRATAIAQAGNDLISDYYEPTIAVARRDLQAGRTIVAAGEGRRRIDAIRADFGEFITAENALLAGRDSRQSDAASRAVAIGAGGLAGSVLLILLFATFVARSVIRPIRRVSAAAWLLAGNDLSVRVPEGGPGEVGDLGRSFNSMADAIQDGRSELENQNIELELQATTLETQTQSLEEQRLELENQNLELRLTSAELESQQVELEVASTELEAQQAELERTLDDLAAEKERVERFYRFADRLMAEGDLEPVSQLAFDEICDFAEAEIGTLYTLDVEQPGVLTLAAARGVEVDKLPAEVTEGAGLPGRALFERRTIAASHGEAGLQLLVFGREVAVRHELHLPLIVDDRVLGLLSIARIADRPFSTDDREAIDHLAGQAAVILSSRLALENATRLGTVNRAVLDATLDGIRLVDLAGNTVLANAEIDRLTTEVFGLPSNSTLPERSTLIARQLVDTQAYDAASAIIASDPEATTLDEWELAASHRSFRRYTAPVRAESGELMGRIIVVREITNEREVARLKTELVATVSHELRTPLTGIMGFAELLAKQELDEPTRRTYVETIHVEALRLTALVNDFLDLQRIEAGGFTLTLAPFDLTELVRHEAALHFAQSDAHTILFRLPDAPLVVQGERDRIGQVLANLLSNAIKYSPAGGEIWVDATVDSSVVRIAISDAGFGIPLDQQAHIFTKFFRVDSSDTRRIGGTGLGLAVSREIVEAHGGNVGFDSTEGEGSTFWFELPLFVPADLTPDGASSEDRSAA